MSSALLEVEGVSVVREGKKILNRLSLKAEAGQITGVLGRNGAGKSSLAYAVMGLANYRPLEGRIRFLGKEITGLSITKRGKMGLTLAWQHPARYEGVSVRDYLRLSSKGAGEKDLASALSLVLLDPKVYLERMVDKNLSGGERKRIELASVYLMKPRLSILDEPDSGVDLLALGEIMQVFRLLAREGHGVLIITHREDVAAQCARSYLMCSGAVVLEGSAEAVKRYFLSQCEPCQEAVALGMEGCSE